MFATPFEDSGRATQYMARSDCPSKTQGVPPNDGS